MINLIVVGCAGHQKVADEIAERSITPNMLCEFRPSVSSLRLNVAIQSPRKRVGA
jgi:hypothetical protein